MKIDKKFLDDRMVIDNIGIGITVSDLTGHFEVFNAKMQELTKYTLDEVNSASDFNALIHPQAIERQEILKGLDEISKDNVCRETETMIRTKDGVEKKLFVSTSLVRYNNKDMFLSVWLETAPLQDFESELQESEIKFRRLFETAQDGILILDENSGQIREVNKFLIDMLGYSREEFLGKQLWQIGAFIDIDKSKAVYQKLKEDGYVRYEDLPLKTKDGRLIHVEFVSNVYKVNKLKVIQCNIRDITDRKIAEEGLIKVREALRQAQEIARIGRWELDLDTRRFALSDEIVSLCEADHQANIITYEDFVKFIHPDDIALVEKAQHDSIINKEPCEIEYRLLMKDGRIKWVSHISRNDFDDEGRHHRIVGTIQEVTVRKNMEIDTMNLAQHDALTQLPNRKTFIERVNHELSSEKRRGMKCALLFIDLDHFKNVNDMLGHSVGDELLKDTAQKIALCIRDIDILARLGGDEFIVFLNDLVNEQSVRMIVDRILLKCNVPRMIAGNDLFVTASIGVAVYPHDGGSLEDLIREADLAMYAAKQSGRNTFRFFDMDMQLKAIKRMQVERSLRDALAKKELALYYQPIINVVDGKLRGFEALIRWLNPDGNIVLPNEFIPVAEDAGLIVTIGEWVIQEACRFNKVLVDAGHKQMMVSVNVSVKQLQHAGFVDIIKKSLDESGLQPDLLEIEVTESLFIDSFDTAVQILKAVKELGASVSLDDFGTGYSSLVHLQKLPLNTLKLDQIFIKKVAKKSDKNTMIPAIIDLAHNLKLKVIAEGVETKKQLGKLSDSLCDYYQGYLYCKPMPQDKVEPFLAHVHNN